MTLRYNAGDKARAELPPGHPREITLAEAERRAMEEGIAAAAADKSRSLRSLKAAASAAVVSSAATSDVPSVATSAATSASTSSVPAIPATGYPAAAACSREEHQQRRGRCHKCPGCLVRENCGTCKACLDMPMFGGRGKCKQACVQRMCTAINPIVANANGADVVRDAANVVRDAANVAPSDTPVNAATAARAAGSGSARVSVATSASRAAAMAASASAPAASAPPSAPVPASAAVGAPVGTATSRVATKVASASASASASVSASASASASAAVPAPAGALSPAAGRGGRPGGVRKRSRGGSGSRGGGGGRFAPGDPVRVRWMADKPVSGEGARYKGKMFAASVTRVWPDGACDVVFEDGDTESRVLPINLRERLTEEDLSTDIHLDLIKFHGVDSLPSRVRQRLRHESSLPLPPKAAEAEEPRLRASVETATKAASSYEVVVSTAGGEGSVMFDEGVEVVSAELDEEPEPTSRRRVKPLMQKLRMVQQRLHLPAHLPMEELVAAALQRCGLVPLGLHEDIGRCFRVLRLDELCVAHVHPGAPPPMCDVVLSATAL